MIFKPKKSLGQNFLIDENIIKKIVNLGNISNNDSVLEVGPGSGKLTKEILTKNPKKLFAVEKDKFLSNQLIEKYKNKIKIFNNDILNFKENKISRKKIIIFGNLPYNISTQILVKWITCEESFKTYKKLILMFQKDVAERIVAKNNEKNYGRLSIISAWRLIIKKEFDVSEYCFYPRPKVKSSVLTFVPKKKYIKFKDPKNLEYITNIFFSRKRKMINKAYHKIFKNNISVIKKLNINLKDRPGNLSSEIYYALTKKYEDLRA